MGAEEITLAYGAQSDTAVPVVCFPCCLPAGKHVDHRHMHRPRPFGFTAYMLYLIYFSEGEFKTAHYSLCTAFMALSMMLPGMVAGYVQEALGYTGFFIFVMICCLVTVVVTAMLKVDPEYGKKH